MRRARLAPAAAGLVLPLFAWLVGAFAATSDGGRSVDADAKAKVVRQLVGSWQLRSFTLRSSDGTVSYPYGKDAVGKLTYTRDGHQWATGARRGAPKNLPDAFWYTGTFDVDRKRRTIVHHVQYSSISAWEGTDLVRSYKLRRDRLALRIAPTSPDGQTGVLKWKRIRNAGSTAPLYHRLRTAPSSPPP